MLTSASQKIPTLLIGEDSADHFAIRVPVLPESGSSSRG